MNTNPFSPYLDHYRFFQIFNIDPAQPLTFNQTAVYIHFLINEVNPDHQIVIEEEAYETIFSLSSGRVEQINRLMDQALRKAFNDRTQVIGQHHVKSAEDANGEGPKKENSVKTSKPKPAAFILVFSILLLGVVSAVWLFGDSKQIPTLEKKTDPTDSVTQEKVKPTPEPPKPTAVSAPEKKLDKHALYSDAPVANFLAAYNLQGYERLFLKALYDESFEEVARQIYNETGLMLIHFTTLPTIFEKKYHILDRLLLNPVHTRYFLFWKPAPVIPKWEYGARGKPIQQVQTMLKKIGIYQGEIDGIVGAELILAILRFQGQNILEKTGIPDPTTLFFLTALSQ